MASRNTPSDEELVRSAQQGKLEAFTTLYERYLHTVYNRVRYTVPEQDVEDVTQEIFIAVMKSLKGFRCESQFNTWLRTLVIRQIADYYRRKSPLQILVEADSKTNDEEDIYARAEKPDQRANMDESMALRHGLATLPEQYREILLMRFADGLQFNEIATANGKSLEATKSLFRRAVAELRRQVEQTNG
jgi:RNA polymerase sigma-70 factor (ECF subfamily)